MSLLPGVWTILYMYIDDMIWSITVLSHTLTCLKVCCWVHQLVTLKCCGEAVDDSVGITETLRSFYGGAALRLYFGFFCSKHFSFFYDFTIPKLQEDIFFCISLNLHVPGNTVLKFLNQIRKSPKKIKIHFILDLLGFFICTFIFKFFHEDQWGVAGTGA